MAKQKEPSRRAALEELSLAELFALRSGPSLQSTKLLSSAGCALDNQISYLARSVLEERINRLKKGDPLPSGVIKMVKVYISPSKLNQFQAGDKLAGRHGNKGVVSDHCSLAKDMPFLEQLAVPLILC